MSPVSAFTIKQRTKIIKRQVVQVDSSACGFLFFSPTFSVIYSTHSHHLLVSFSFTLQEFPTFLPANMQLKEILVADHGCVSHTRWRNLILSLTSEDLSYKQADSGRGSRTEGPGPGFRLEEISRSSDSNSTVGTSLAPLVWAECGADQEPPEKRGLSVDDRAQA